jgi:hypothetical protein
VLLTSDKPHDYNLHDLHARAGATAYGFSCLFGPCWVRPDLRRLPELKRLTFTAASI